MAYYNEKLETATRKDLEDYQIQRFRSMLSKVMVSNEFYRKKYGEAGVDPDSIRKMSDMRKLPFLTKEEIEEDQRRNPLFGTMLTEPLENYVQYHQTTGTVGEPVRLLDTKESWEWRGRCASYILAAAGVTREDTVMFTFNFGPYTGFWILYEGAYQTGCLIIPTGGWNTEQRLDCIMKNKPTVVTATPTYALRLASTAAERGVDLRNSAVRTLILTGEAGALVPELRAKIENVWGAPYYDYVGLTEVGTWGFQCDQSPTCTHVMEPEFIMEIIDPETGDPVPEGEPGELVLTNLGRTCTPSIRFRTRDIVKTSLRECGCGRTLRMLEGGVLGRQDQMVKIRGTNIFPSSVGLVVERYLEPGYEYRIIACRENERDGIKIMIEKSGSEDSLAAFSRELGAELKKSFNLNFEIEIEKKGKLPRYEYKAKRFSDERKK